MKVIERLQYYIECKEFSLNSFDLTIGMEHGYIRTQIKDKSAIGSDVLERIFLCYPDLNPTWLLTGKGSMLLHESSGSTVRKTRRVKKTHTARVMDKLPVDEIMAYIHTNETIRGFDKSKMYKLFLELRLENKVHERLMALEAEIDQLLREYEEGNYGNK
ncbi:MAG: hypothetical protein AAF934_02040 [Bacteroidota bacterium]